MVGSPNPGYFVYDGDNPTAGNGPGPAGSADRADAGVLHVDQGIPRGTPTSTAARDYGPFIADGIPTGGIVHRRRGHQDRRPGAALGRHGGTAFDPCYHRSCDTITNINDTALDRNIDTIGHMVWLYADKDYGTTTPPTPRRAQPAGEPRLRVRCRELGRAPAGPITNNTGRPARTGSWKAWLGGNGSTSTENISQQVTIPATATAASLSYWIRTDTAESGFDGLRHPQGAGGQRHDDHDAEDTSATWGPARCTRSSPTACWPTRARPSP